MNPRSLLNFLKTPTGRFIGFCVLATLALTFTRGCHRQDAEDAAPVTPRTDNRPASGREVMPLPSPAKPRKEASDKETPVEVLPSLSLYSAVQTQAVEMEFSADFAPYGRMIPCRLVVTVDSSDLGTPIVALVLEDLWFNGRLLIPAGSEAHGQAAPHRLRDRIASEGQWVFVLPGGGELALPGVALDMDRNPDGRGWGITDGSAGLRGQIVKASQSEELRLFVATFLSGATEVFKERQMTLLGSQTLPQAKNAALNAGGAVIDLYAQRLLEQIERESYFVRVAAGKNFYVYVRDTLDTAKGRIGGHSLAAPGFGKINVPSVNSSLRNP